MLRWVRKNALGEPVVPEVHDSSAGAVGAGVGRSSFRSPSSDSQLGATCPANSGSSTRIALAACASSTAPTASPWRAVVKTSRAALEASAVSNCSASARSSIGTTTPPAASTARAATIQTGELGAHSATRLPLPTPASRSPLAKRSVLSATVALSQVATRSSPNGMIAGCWLRAVRSRSRPVMFQEVVTRNSGSLPQREDVRDDNPAASRRRDERSASVDGTQLTSRYLRNEAQIRRPGNIALIHVNAVAALADSFARGKHVLWTEPYTDSCKAG